MFRKISILIAAVVLTNLFISEPARAQACVDPPSGMIAWWPGDGDPADIHAGLDATLVGGAGFAPGLVGLAFRLDGIGGGQDDLVSMPASALHGLADFTVETWVQTTDDNAAILSAANDVGDNEFLLYQTAAGLYYFVEQESTGPFSPGYIGDGAWHHVAFVRESDMGRLYVDGVLIDERPIPTGPTQVSDLGLLLGQEQDCLGGCFQPNQAMDGLIDELSIYSRALSDDEIFELFDAGSAGKCKPASVDDVMARIEALEAEIDALNERVMELEASSDPSCDKPGDEPGDRGHSHRWRGFGFGHDEHDRDHHRNR